MTRLSREELIRLAHQKTREMWLDRREREDKAGAVTRLTLIRRQREDEIIAKWDAEEAA